MAIAELIMPKMGESIMEATILRWHKKVGDSVKQDETILDIATDKVDSEIPSPSNGIITELLYPVNSVVPVGSVIAKIQTDLAVGTTAPAAFKPIQPTPVYEQPQPVVAAPAPVYYQQPQQVPPPPPVSQPVAEIPFQPQQNFTVPKSGNNRFFSPLVLNIANSEGISLSELERIPGTGADGRVSKKDVVQYIADKRAGKIPVYTTAPQAPSYAPATAFRAPQPSIYIQEPTPTPVEQYPPVYVPTEPIAPITSYINPIVETAPQPIISTFPTVPSHPLTTQPLYANQLAVPVATVPIQPIVDINPFAQPGFLPVQPIVTSVPAPVIESIPVQPLAASVPTTSVIESIPAQPLVEQSGIVDAPIVQQPIVAPIVEREHSTITDIPIIPTLVVPAPAIPEAVITPPINHTAANDLTPQPLVQNGNGKTLVSGLTPQPIIPSSGVPSLENKYTSLQPVAAYSTGQPEQKAAPIATTKPSSGNGFSSAVLEPLVAGSSSNKPADLNPIFGKPIDKSFVGVQHHAKNLKPVYLVPPATPDVPLVTLAEGSSGKFTSPESAHPSGNVEIIEMDRMRKLIAKHMVDSKHTSPHVTSFTEADVTNMVFWRDRVKSDFEKREGTKLTFTPMFIDCLVKVMKKYPLINSSVEGDKIILKKDINIGMATALPTGNLIVPVIKGADQLNIVGLSAAVNKLANDARNNQLKPDDVSGGTFTFTNVGTFGTLMGTPIINQPQVAILAVGMIKKRPVVIESPDNDTIGIRHMMYLSLSYDHRVIDGSVGASFLTELAKEFEQWDLNRTWYHYL